LISKQGKKECYWLGGYLEKGKWQWVTGESFTYKNWASGQPDNSNGREDKIIIIRVQLWGANSGQWNDVGNMTSAYICEWDAD